MELSYALWITLIGMGLVFFAILLLWALMALLVRVTAEKEPSAKEAAAGAGSDEEQIEAESVSDTNPAASPLLDRKRRAAGAAAAAAIALSQSGQIPGAARPQARPAGAASQWQAVNRASQINQIRNASRKKVDR